MLAATIESGLTEQLEYMQRMELKIESKDWKEYVINRDAYLLTHLDLNRKGLQALSSDCVASFNSAPSAVQEQIKIIVNDLNNLYDLVESAILHHVNQDRERDLSFNSGPK